HAELAAHRHPDRQGQGRQRQCRDPPGLAEARPENHLLAFDPALGHCLPRVGCAVLNGAVLSQSGLMFYRTDQKHGLPHNPFNSIVAPRPIGWISTLDRDGRPNLAPYSFFNAVSYAPPQVIFSGGPRPARRGEDVPMKDSVINARETGEFVVNIATWETR